MKIVLKKWLLKLLVLSMTILIIPLHGVVAEASTNTGYSVASAIPVSLGDNYYKYWTKSNYSYDCYNKFTIPERGYITFRFSKPIDSSGEYGNIDFELFNSYGIEVWSSSTSYSNKVIDYYEFSIGLEAGTYYLNVDPRFTVTSGSIGTAYYISFNASQYVEVEPNEGVGTATPISLGTTIKGFLNTNYFEKDYYKFYLDRATNIKVSIDSFAKLEDTGKYFYFIDSNGSEIMQIESKWKISGDGSYYTYLSVPAGANYFYIKGNGEPLEYNITFSEEKIGSTYFTAINTVDRNAVLKWTEVKGADGYTIYRATSENGSYSKVTSVTGSSATYYQDYVYSSRYYYKVQAYKAAGYSTIYGELSAAGTWGAVATPDWYNHWGSSAIKEAMDKGWVDKTDKFRPEDPITRAEFIKIVNRVFGFKEKLDINYADVKSGYWYYDEVRVAAKAGYISIANKYFYPNSPITREEVAAILTSLKNNKDDNLDKINAYTDKNKVSTWALTSVEGAIEAGYLGQGSLLFRPKDRLVRAEAVASLSRIK